MNNIKYSREANYNSNIILVDGFSGTGKSLTLDLLNAFNGVGISHSELIFDYLPILYHFNPDSEDFAKAILKNRFDEITYNFCTSRNINFRLKDLSSVFKHPNWFNYLKNLFKNVPNDKVFEKEIVPKLNIPIWTHSTSFNNDFYLKTFGERIKILFTVRDPLLSVNNYKNYLDKIVKTPKEIQLKYAINGIEYPWYAKDWEEEYTEANSTEKSIKILSNGYNNLFKNFIHNKNINRTKCLIIFFENLISETDKNFYNIADFLSIDYRQDLYRKLKKRNNIPRKLANPIEGYHIRFKEKNNNNLDINTTKLLSNIEAEVRPIYFDLLISLIEKYYKFKFDFNKIEY